MSDLIELKLVTEDEAECLHRLQVEAFMPLYEKYQDDDTSPAKESLERITEKIIEENSDFYFISVGETPTSISGEMKHISLSGGYNPPTEIKPDRGLQECAEEDVSKADAHSAARTLGRS